MLRSRIIPCLLVHKGALVKTQRFKDPKYIGDPLNAVRIFNEKEADELIVLDIDATVKKREPDFGLIKNLAAECRMPLCYGGGVKSVDQAVKIIDVGVEKVALNAAAIKCPKIVTKISSKTGRQSVVVIIDIRRSKSFLNKSYEVCTHNGSISYKINPLNLALDLQEKGAGEIIFNSIDNDGKMQGYDIDFAFLAKQKLSIPTTFLGGAGSIDHMKQLIEKLGVVGVAAGSLFVFKGKYRAVLINYPSPETKKNLI